MTRGLLAALLLGAAATGADAAQVFWASEPARPGDVVLVYGGDLGRVREVGVWRLADGEPASPPGSAAPSPGRPLRVPALQPDEGSLKFVLPAALAPGVFEIDVDGARRLLGRPRVDWIQPVRLLPGLDVNQAAPGTVIQVIGRNFPPRAGRRTRRGSSSGPPRVGSSRSASTTTIDTRSARPCPRTLPPGPTRYGCTTATEGRWRGAGARR